MSDMELSAEAKERIERSRQAALLKKQERAAAAAALEACAPIVTTIASETNIDDQLCSMCNSKQRHEPYFTQFKEKVCGACIKSHDEYGLISQGEAKANYLLTSSAINTMPYLEQMNPKHAQWTTMKLYLKKHVIEKSLKRWQTLEALAEEKAKREAQKFERQLQDVEDKINPSKGVGNATSKTASKKRKFNDSLAEMVANIKGVPYVPKK